MHAVLATRVFDNDAQIGFATLSGDLNPMHVDALAARRTQAGAPVVHGVHTLIWALESLAEHGMIVDLPFALNVRFKKFVYVGDTCELVVSQKADHQLRCIVTSDGLTTTQIDISYDAAATQSIAREASLKPIEVGPRARELTLNQIASDAGSLELQSVDELAAMFPNAARRFGASTIASLAQLSTLVGMVCPGLYSIFESIAVSLDGSGSNERLDYSVRAVDERFRLVEIAVSGAGLQGEIAAFLRQPPVAQPSLESVSEHVESQEFAGTTALIIGGSRGLGALCARILVAGGARVILSYVVGEHEARALADELGNDRARVIRYDARAAATAQFEQLPWNVDQLYYFATAQIYRASNRIFSASRFAEFSKIYVEGFEAACTALIGHGAGNLTAFYPSTVFVHERPREMTEYAMAKAAGEALCFDLNRFVRNLRVVAVRLPRLLTDQTATVMPLQLDDPLSTLLPVVRTMQDSNGGD